MNARVLTAIIGLPLLLLCLYVGGWLFALVCGALAVLAALEAGKLLAARGWQVLPPLDVAVVLLITCGAGLIGLGTWWPFFLTVLLAALVYAFYAQRRELPLAQSLVMAVIALYIGLGLGALLALRLIYQGGWYVALLAFLNVWATDIAAYEVGRRWGKVKLAPLISPHKTWEGALAGLLSAAIICTAFICFFFRLPFFKALEFALLFSLVAQAGDLLESAFKRWAGVKDSGSLFPGHGGVLDRFDSILLSAPVMLMLLPGMI